MRTAYEIRDVGGTLRAVHVRVGLPGGKKTMYWQRPDGSDGLGGVSTVDLPLYGSEIIPELRTGQPVFLCEGEGAARALWGWDIPALGTVTGAGSTPGEDALGVLLGFDVVLWPDHDREGYAHMNRVAWELKRLSGAAPRGLLADVRGRAGAHLHGLLPRGYDAADFVADSTRATLRRLAAEAGPWPLVPDAPPAPVAVAPAVQWTNGEGRRVAARSQLYQAVMSDLGRPARHDGRGAWWLCPFHAEKTPSFKVSTVPDEPFYRCFGCGARGDVFTYQRDRAGLGYGATLRALAPGLGPIPRLVAAG